MILVDTTVLINYLKGYENDKTKLFDDVLRKKMAYGISAYTYQELLQGVRDEREYDKLKNYLSTQTVYFLPEEVKTYEAASRLYFELRRQGITPRSTIDILIVLTAIWNDLFLLHDDKDFDIIADKVDDFQILNSTFA